MFSFRLLLTIGVFLLLTEQGFSETPNLSGNQPGRWMIAPMPNGIPETIGGSPRPAVWRLDTQTGALQVCFYSANVSIVCFAADYPQPSLFHNPYSK
jgi:hypothetical protein